MKEYQYSRDMRVFMYILTPLVIGSGIWGSIAIFQAIQSGSSKSLYVLIIFIIAFSALSILGFLEVRNTKYTITSVGIERYSPPSSRELLLHQIAGYRMGERDGRIFLIPKEKHHKKLQISNYTEHLEEIKKWVEAHFENLDVAEASSEQEQIFRDSYPEIIAEEHFLQLRRAKVAASNLTIMSVLACVWIVFYPKPYLLACLMAFLCPLLILYAIIKYRGLIQLNERKNSELPHMFFGLITTLGIAFRAGIDFDIVQFRPLAYWTLGLSGSVIFLFRWLLKNKSKQVLRVPDFTLLAFCILLWSGGIITVLNCAYDDSEPQIFEPIILEKRTSRGKRGSVYYSLELAPWGPRKENAEVATSERNYVRREKGEPVFVYVRNGRLGIPWFWINN